MSYFCDDVDAALGGYHTTAYTGLGLRGDAVPSTGADGPSVLYPCLSLPADSAVEVFAQTTRLPTLGTLAFEEDGSFIYTGSSDYLRFRLWVDGVASNTNIGYGPGIVDVALNVGLPSAFTAGATLGGVQAAGSLGTNRSAVIGGATLAAIRAGGALRSLSNAPDRFGPPLVSVSARVAVHQQSVAIETPSIEGHPSIVFQPLSIEGEQSLTPLPPTIEGT